MTHVRHDVVTDVVLFSHIKQLTLARQNISIKTEGGLVEEQVLDLRQAGCEDCRASLGKVKHHTTVVVDILQGRTWNEQYRGIPAKFLSDRHHEMRAVNHEEGLWLTAVRARNISQNSISQPYPSEHNPPSCRLRHWRHHQLNFTIAHFQYTTTGSFAV